MIQNYFADLELGADASLEDVRRAYKRLARRFHPDLNPADAQAEESFRKISEAFAQLNSATRIVRQKKKIGEAQVGLSRSLKSKNFGQWGNYPLVPMSVEQFVDQWTDEPSINRRFQRPQEELDISISVDVKKSELKDGFLRRVKVSVERPCGSCRGSGGRSRSIQATCKRCAGLGHFLIERGAMHWKKACDDCSGKGHVVASPCTTCEGKGKIQLGEIIDLKISKNADASRPIRLRGLGNSSFDGKKRGDLWVQLVQKS